MTNRPHQFRFVVVCGGYRTGSTLQYNLVGGYLEGIGLGRRLGLVDPDDVASVLERWDEPAGFVGVAKSHHVVDGFHHFRDPTAWQRLVESGDARPIATWRDQTARRASMCRKFGIAEHELDDSWQWRDSEANTRRWRELGSFEQAYRRLVNDPVGALREVCIATGLPWQRRAAVGAAAAADRESARSIMQRLDVGSYDPVTLLHWDHISS